MSQSQILSQPTSSFVRRGAVALVVATVALSSGCLTPFVSRRAQEPEPRPAPTVIAGLSVTNPGERTVLDVAQDTGLSEFGEKAVEPIQAALAAKGFALTFDKIRVKEINTGGINNDAASAAITGAYTHPEASYWTPDLLRGPFVQPKDLIVKIRGEDPKELYAFVGIVVRQQGIIVKEPQIELRVTVYDREGQAVLDLRGLGAGDGSVFFANRAPGNLQVALERAITSFETLEEGAL